MRPAPAVDGFQPGVVTEITVDYPDFTLSQPPFWKSLSMFEITGTAIRPGTSGVHFLNRIGYQLETIHDRASYVHEEDQGAPFRKVITGAGSLYVAAPLKAIPTLTGVPTGSQVQGDNHDQKQIAASGDWSAANLAADQAAFPSPVEDEIVPCDRIFVDSNPMAPDETVWVRTWVPNLGAGASIGVIDRVLFTGLASTPNDETRGTGQYSLTRRADGQAFLRELDQGGTWKLRKFFQWSPPHMVAGHWHMMAIRSDAYLDDDGHWQGSVINFQCQVNQDFMLLANVVGASLGVGVSTTQYVVPQTVRPQAITQSPLRFDSRRDVRQKISLSFTRFLDLGTLQTQTFNIPFLMGAIGADNPDILLLFTGSFPLGTSGDLDIAMYTWDGHACTAHGSVGNNKSQAWKSFQPYIKADGLAEQDYYAIVTYHSSVSHTRSPIIRQLDIQRDGVVSTGTPTPYTLPQPGTVLNYSIMGAGMDPRTKSASIGLISLQDGFTAGVEGVDDPIGGLSKRSGQSCKIKLTGLPSATVNGHAQTTSIIFLGKARELRRKRFGTQRYTPLLKDGLVSTITKALFPSKTAWHGRLFLNGLWQRLLQAKTPKMYNFGVNQTTHQPYKIGEIARQVLQGMGLPDAMVDIPDTSISLLFDPNDQNKSSQLEVYSEAFGFVLDLVKQYLGAAIRIDENATNGGGSSDQNGCVRLVLAPRPDPLTGAFLPVAQFVDDANWNDGTIRSKSNIRSYAPFTRADSRQIPVAPALGGTLEYWDEPPAANCVYVTGTGAVAPGGSLQSATGNSQLWAILHNWPAGVFFDGQPIAADPTHPDYTDGTPNLLVVVDPSLNTQAAVNMAARRYFDFECHRREYCRVETAGIVMVLGNDPITGTGSDSKQIRLRPLDWSDPVLYQGKDWFVDSAMINVEGAKGGTRNATVVYTLFRIPGLMKIEDGETTVYNQYQLYGPVAAAVA